MWTDEQIEEMGFVEPFDRAFFLSGCGQHRLGNGDIEGYIISEEKLQKFAELIIQEHEKTAFRGR